MKLKTPLKVLLSLVAEHVIEGHVKATPVLKMVLDVAAEIAVNCRIGNAESLFKEALMQAQRKTVEQSNNPSDG